MHEPKSKDTTISVRLSGEQERTVRRYARRRRSSVSDVIRDAVRVLVDQPAAKDRPYDDMADLIGSVSGLPADLSERTGARFAEIVQEKAGRRR